MYNEDINELTSVDIKDILNLSENYFGKLSDIEKDNLTKNIYINFYNIENKNKWRKNYG